MDELYAHARRYPRWEAEDALKLLYQRYMGCGHFAPDPQAAAERLAAEWEQTPADDGQPLWEDIGGGYGRIYLAAAKAAGIAPETVVRVFCASAQPATDAKRAALLEAARAVEPGPLGIAPQAWTALLERWRADGCPQVSHSVAYRRAYRPAYRVAEARFAPWLPLLDWIIRRAAGHEGFTLAIDGRSGAGKSSLAACLADGAGAALIHMDDFFLPAARKTPERLAQPGGNVDIERFCQEVIAPLRAGRPVTYRPYSCQTGRLGAAIQLPSAPLTVVEGVYSLHPAAAFPYDGSVFLAVAPAAQRERIGKRSGLALLARYDQEWIPLEEKYFHALAIPQRADVCFDPQRGGFLQPGQVW